MTTTQAITCPEWCTKDHDRQADRARELFARYVASGEALDVAAEHDENELDILERGMTHTARFGDHPRFNATVEVGPDDVPEIYGVDPDRMTAIEARAYAHALLAAADLIDRIESVSG